MLLIGDVWAHPQTDHYEARVTAVAEPIKLDLTEELGGVFGSGTEDVDVPSPAGLQLLDLCKYTETAEEVLGPRRHPELGHGWSDKMPHCANWKVKSLLA